ncbi:MAG: LysR family transcriptional regulator [Nevskia sp.]|nr:LysR family transcriptional regulator [Nevskia sp.]
MSMQNLRYFAAVVQHGSAIKAARRAGVSQPALSAGIRALEAELGTALFERPSGRSLRLTAAGRRFQARAQRILDEFDAARAETAAGAGAQRMRLGVLATLAPDAVARYLAGLRAEFGAGVVEVWEGAVPQLAQWLRQKRLDAAITLAQGPARQMQPLFAEPYVLLVPRQGRHARFASGEASLADLHEAPLVARFYCEMLGSAIAHMRRAGVAPRIVARPERDETALRLVAEGLGVTLAPKSLAGGALRALPLRDLQFQRRIALKWRPGLPPPVLARLKSALAAP